MTYDVPNRRGLGVFCCFALTSVAERYSVMIGITPQQTEAKALHS